MQHTCVTDTKLQQALKLVRRGFHVFPLHHPTANGACSCGDATCTTVGKHPYGELAPHSWKNATLSEPHVTRWWTERPDANIGVATGLSKLAVIDADPRNGGDQSLTALMQAHTPLPSTHTVRTGGGGSHIYFQRTHGIYSRTGLLPGLDVKADGGYVVAAGSIHMSGKMYETSVDVEPAEAPQWLLELISPSAGQSSVSGHHWLVKAFSGVSEGSRNETAARIAGYLFNRGLPLDVVEMLVSEFGARCTPALAPAEARRTVFSIANRQAVEPDDERAEFAEDAHSWALRTGSLPRPAYLIDGLIREGATMMVHGQPRSGKSWILLELALALTHGVPAFHVDGLRPGNVVPVSYYTEEDSECEVRDRLVGLFNGHDLDRLSGGLKLAVKTGLDLDNAAHQIRLIQEVKARGDRVVIFDPIRSLSQRVDQGPAELQPLVRFLRRLMREAECAVWLGHHDTKPINGRVEGRSKAQRASGGGIFSISDSPVQMECIGRAPMTVVATPSDFKFGDTPCPYAIQLEVEPGPRPVYRLLGKPVDLSAVPGNQSVAELVLAVVRSSPGQSGSSYARALGKQKSGVLAALHKLKATGEVYYHGRGWFPAGS